MSAPQNLESITFAAQRNPTPPPEKLPDDGEGGKPGHAAKPCSFRDKLMGNETVPPPPMERTNLIKDGFDRIEHERGNRLFPKVYIAEKMFDDLCRPWKEALIIKLLGKNVGFRTMQYKLANTWKLLGGFDLMDIDNGFYMVKFDSREDLEKVMGGGPWMVFDHYLAVATWSPDFSSERAEITKTLVWIRFPGMNLVYYDENLLLAMASAIGTPVKVDRYTTAVERGRFARVCVEIDLSQPVVGKIWVRGVWHKVQYEGLHVICSRCGCYGHYTRNYTSSEKPPEAATKVNNNNDAQSGTGKSVILAQYSPDSAKQDPHNIVLVN